MSEEKRRSKRVEPGARVTSTKGLEILEESALAVAQATIQNAMDAAGLQPAELASWMGHARSYTGHMLSGNHNLTVKTFARALAVCGYRLEFSCVPLDEAPFADAITL